MNSLAKEIVRDVQAETHQFMRPKAHHTPWQPIPILVAMVVPSLVFAWLYYCCFSGLRFYHPAWAAVIGVLPCFVACLVTSLQARERLRQVVPVRGVLTLAICLWLAFFSALLGGEHNYWWHMVSYYNFQDLAAYTDIDPTMDKGQSYMDAGQVYFREFSKVLTEQMVAFRSQHVYCAAPIMLSPVDNQDSNEQVEQDGLHRIPRSGTVDFWVVGMDCCDQETRTFTCGAVGDPRARAGIRLLRDDIRPFYVLAVQEWAARLCPLDDNTLQGRSQAAPLICPQSRHPLFFHWVVDPLLEVDNFYTKAMSMYTLHFGLWCAGNFFAVLTFMYIFFVLGVR